MQYKHVNIYTDIDTRRASYVKSIIRHFHFPVILSNRKLRNNNS